MSTKLTITARPDTRYRADARPLIVEITTPDATTDVCGSGWRIGDQPIHITAQRGEFFEVGGGLSRTSRRGLLALRDAIDAALALASCRELALSVEVAGFAAGMTAAERLAVAS